ncbi:response regulator transcription factor [Streptomyces desertarenae]|uniref:Response regulator transcription factor n=2 Tax=Streptomyces desertarenae TaxID=2666184 RepID=A0ABW4PSV6_9ACTN
MDNIALPCAHGVGRPDGDGREEMLDSAGNDYARMVNLAVSLLEAPAADAVWRPVTRELMRALSGDVIVAKDTEWTQHEGEVAVWPGEGKHVRPPDEEATRIVRIGYPFAGYYGATADRSPRTAAQLVGARTWRHSETASVMRASFGSDHLLGIPLPTPDSPVRGFVVHRAGGDFTDRERTYATRIQPLLRAAATQRVLLARLRGADERAVRHGLTARETAVLHLLAEGHTAHGMARRLHVSVRTVHKHLQNLYRKLDAPDRLRAVLRAQELGLLTPLSGRRGGVRPTGGGQPG